MSPFLVAKQMERMLRMSKSPRDRRALEAAMFLATDVAGIIEKGSGTLTHDLTLLKVVKKMTDDEKAFWFVIVVGLVVAAVFAITLILDPSMWVVK